jgi:hypothetical protein
LRHVPADRDRLSFSPGGYRLRVLPGELDAERFESLGVQALEDRDPARRAELIGQALALWQGTPYQRPGRSGTGRRGVAAVRAQALCFSKSCTRQS